MCNLSLKSAGQVGADIGKRPFSGKNYTHKHLGSDSARYLHTGLTRDAPLKSLPKIRKMPKFFDKPAL